MSTPGRQVRKPFGSDIGSNDAMRSASASPFVRSSSTPQRLYEAARNAGGSNGQASLAFVGAACSDSPTSFEHNSPFISRNSPVRRKNASLGSPGVRALANAANQTRAAGSRPKSGLRSDTTEHPKPHSGRRSAAFIRKKTFQQRLTELPTDAYDGLLSLLQTIEEGLTDPSLGYPLAIALHVTSLLTHLISPNSELSFSLLFDSDGSSSFDKGSNPGESLFGAGASRRRGGVRKLVQASRITAWSWTASIISCILVALSVWNAWQLLNARRRYRLWTRSPDDPIASRNARLVPIDLDDEEDQPSLQERASAWLVGQLRKFAVIRWFISDVTGHQSRSGPLKDARIHELSVWEVHEVPLRIATVYSPLHALLWHLAGSPLVPISSFLAWISFLLLQAGLAGQMVLLATSFGGLVRDRALLAAEVMHEYDEKFVLPRAMPAVKDVGVMTSEAETIAPAYWRTT